MASKNLVILLGNVGRDPEVRYLDQQNKVAQFPLATSEFYKDRDGQRRELTEWHNIVAFRHLADLVEKYVRKGSQLHIEGKLRTRQWNDQTGAKRYTTEVVCNDIQLCGTRQELQDTAMISTASQMSEGQQPRPAAQPAAQPAPATPAAPGPGVIDPPTDDLPF